uniref:Uncharacterized protein n=1 Tax=Arundo donax TaxID=35708 RepID=A0A0A9BAH7_ARUDO
MLQIYLQLVKQGRIHTVVQVGRGPPNGFGASPFPV